MFAPEGRAFSAYKRAQKWRRVKRKPQKVKRGVASIRNRSDIMQKERVDYYNEIYWGRFSEAIFFMAKIGLVIFLENLPLNQISTKKSGSPQFAYK